MPADVYDSHSAPTSQGIRDTVAHLRDDVQERARLARQVLQGFTKEHVEGKDSGQLPPSIARRWEELNRYAAVMRIVRKPSHNMNSITAAELLSR